MNILLRRFGPAECGTIERANGQYLQRSDVAAMLRDIVDDDDLNIVLEKIKAYHAQVVKQ